MSSETFLSDELVTVRVQWLLENAVRITAAPGGQVCLERPWIKEVLLTQPDLITGRICLEVGLEKGRVKITDRGKTVAMESRVATTTGNGRIGLGLRIDAQENFYGWGEWFNAFQRQNGKIRLFIEEAISWIQGRATYSAIPWFMSSKGYAFFLLNSHTSRWRIDKRRGEMVIDADGPGLDYIVIQGPSYKRIIESYTALTGRPPLLPRWAFGLWVTSFPQEHQDKVLWHVREHRRRKLPLDAVILDYQWEEHYHNMKWRKPLMPEPMRMISELKTLGMRLGLIFTPFINKKNATLQKFAFNLVMNSTPRDMITWDDRDLEGYGEGLAKGVFAHPDAAWWFGRGGMLDFANPKAAAWWIARLDPLYRMGVDFFKNDDGEHLPVDAQSEMGINGREYHNLYGFFYGRAIHGGMEALDDRRAVIYARSVWAGSQRYPAMFLGDQNPTYPCLRRVMRAGLNLSLAGFAYWTADVFGLSGKTTPELHMRHAQWTLLNPVARYFWRPETIDGTRFPWSWSEREEENFRTYSRLRYRLLPYYCALAWQAWQTGLPILRPMMLEFQDDPRFAGCYDQMMLGSNLLLAPILEPKAIQRKVQLPKGEWHDFWSNASWRGPGEVDYPAPFDRMPILVRGSGIVPMGTDLEYIGEDHAFSTLELHCWPPYPAQGVLIEEDGLTRAYQRGEYARTCFKVEHAHDNLVVTITQREGCFRGKPEVRKIKLILHRIDPVKSIWLEGKTQRDWHYDPVSRELYFAFDHLPEQETRVSITHV